MDGAVGRRRRAGHRSVRRAHGRRRQPEPAVHPLRRGQHASRRRGEHHVDRRHGARRGWRAHASAIPTACVAPSTRSRRATGAKVVHGAEVRHVVAGSAPVGHLRRRRCRDTRSQCRLVSRRRRTRVLRAQVARHRTEAQPRPLSHGWPTRRGPAGLAGDGLRHRHRRRPTCLLVFPQIDGRARLYLGFRADDKKRLAGGDKAEAFLDAFRCSMIPD